jgi:hypothetical protein
MALIPGVVVDLTPLTTTPLTVIVAPITANSEFGTKKILLTATLINATGTDLVGRKNVSILNNGLSAVFISNKNTVSKTAGMLIAPGATGSFDVDINVPTPLYGISYGVPNLVSIVEV